MLDVQLEGEEWLQGGADLARPGPQAGSEIILSCFFNFLIRVELLIKMLPFFDKMI